jgi:hypothetical protein
MLIAQHLSRDTHRVTLDARIGTHSGQRHMKSGEWKTYRTRFLVKARQLSSSLAFVDNLGRQHSGRKGDYLVESAEGVISIAPRQIFEDIYVAMGAEVIAVEEKIARPGDETPVARKLPQPWRDRRAASAPASAL